MQPSLELRAQKRAERGRHVDQLRKNRMIPAVVYGHGFTNEVITVPQHAMEEVFRAGGESTLIDLRIQEREPVKVLIHDVQWDPLRHAIRHVDFLRIKMDEKIHTDVEVSFHGIAPAVKDLGGILVKNVISLEVECLPKDLPHDIPVDITVLKTFEDNIRVKDLKLPVGIEIFKDPEEIVATVSEPRSEEELAELNQTVVEDVAAVGTVVEEKKKSEDEVQPTQSESK